MKRPVKRWHIEVMALVGALLAGLLLAGALWKWGISDTTWSASEVPHSGITVIRGTTTEVAQIRVTNTGHNRDGYASCYVWGFSYDKGWQHVASGYAELPVILEPGQTWKMPVDVTAEQGFPANVVFKVTAFTAACYDVE